MTERLQTDIGIAIMEEISLLDESSGRFFFETLPDASIASLGHSFVPDVDGSFI